MLSDEVYDLLADRAYREGKLFAERNHKFPVDAPLSGEWGGDPTPFTVIADLGLDPYDIDDADYNGLTEAWESGYYDFFGKDDDE